MKTKPDVIVVGGGAVGVCTAYYLWRQGLEVTLVERNGICTGCSFGNAGFIVPSHIIPLASPGIIAKGLKWMLSPTSPFYIKPRLDFGLLSWLWKFRQSSTEKRMKASIPLLNDLCQKSADLILELNKIPELEFGLVENGLLTLQMTEKGFEEEREVGQLAQEIGLETRIVRGKELSEIEPLVGPDVYGAVYYLCDSHLQPYRFVNGLYEFLEARGPKFIKDCEVIGFEQSNGRIQTIKTTKGDLAAGEFVIAAGAWTSGILKHLEINLPLQAGKGYSVTARINSRVPKVPLILTEARGTVTPMGDHIRFGGTMELAGIDLSINTRRVDAILNAVPQYLPEVKPRDFPEPVMWAGLRPCTPDGLPYIGRSTVCQNLIIATGHAMLGVTLAPITGQLVTEIIDGSRPSVDLTGLNVERFN